MPNKELKEKSRINNSVIKTIQLIHAIHNQNISEDYIVNSIDQDQHAINLKGIGSFLKRNGFSTNYKPLNTLDFNTNNTDCYPFILPIKGNGYVVIKKKKKEKFKVFDPVRGIADNKTMQELNTMAAGNKINRDLIAPTDYLFGVHKNELQKYQIDINTTLEKNSTAQLFDKLAYFKYLKDNFGFKDFDAEKNYILDLINEQELPIIPKKFRATYLNQSQDAYKSPTVLSVLPSKKQPIKKNDSSIYYTLFKELKGQKKLWGIYIFAAFFSSLIAQLAVFINQLLIDHILPSFNIRTLYLFCIGLAIYKLFDIFTSTYKRFVAIHLKNALNQFFLQKFDSKINTFSLSYIQSFKKGDLIERVSDSIKLKQFFTKFFINISIDLMISFYSLLILLYINWKLTLLIIGIMVVFYFWFKFITPFLKRNEKIRFKEKANFLSKIIEKIEGIQVIKSFGIEQNQSHKINKSIDKYLKIQLKNEYLSLLNTLVVSLIVASMSIIIILLLSHNAITTQAISLGQIITYIALSSKIFSALKSLLNQNLTLQENQIILNRFFDFNETQPEEDSKKGIVDFEINSLDLENVNFGYQPSSLILDSINFSIEKGSKTQIEGTNGSGKSTLSKLITSLYKSDSGQILINNTLSTFYDQRTLKSKILLATNDDILFNESIYDNICLGKDIAIEKIIDVAKTIQFYDFIADKKDTFSFMIEGNGKNVSTGQRKKIILLRAFFSTAEVLIFDEVLSGIDKESRIAIEHYINTDKRAFIIVSHEPIEHILFSKKYVLKNGKLHVV